MSDIITKSNKLLVLPSPEERYVYDVAPPSVFMMSKTSSGEILSQIPTEKDTLSSHFDLALLPGESKTFHIVIGIVNGKGFDAIQQQVQELFEGANLINNPEGFFASQWKERLPDLSAEKNKILKREMLWNEHMVEASAKYSDYYKETFIPQGSVYSYH